MSYIENIKNNIAKAIKVREIATSQGLDYETAKVMYHNGKNDIDAITAQEVIHLIKKYGISLDLIDSLDILKNYYEQEDNITLGNIYDSIYKYANRKYMEDLSDYINVNYYYGQAIYQLIKSGNSIDQAITIFDKKISNEMKKNGLSELAAITKLLIFKENLGAIEFEKSYKAGKAIKDDPAKTIKEQLFTSEEFKQKVVHGIRLISKTEKGLKDLESLVNVAYKVGNQQFLSQLSLQSANNDLFITDFLFCSNYKGSYYTGYYKHIRLLPKKSTEEALATFFHEATHFLDNVKLNSNTFSSFFSTDNQIIKELLEKIKAKGNIVLKGLSTAWLPNTNAHQYVHNPMLTQKWLAEIKRDNSSASPEELKLFYQQKIMYERKKYKVLIVRLENIYDGLTNGKISSFGGSGHGTKYYKNPDNIAIEFIAEIGSLYNCGGIDVLYHELGQDLTEKLVNMYQSFLEFDKEGNDIIKR